MNTLRFPLALLLCVSFGIAAVQAAAPQPSDPLAQGFATPADAYKPWCYWWWLKANVTEQSIRSDLQAMHRKGFGGCLLFDARGYHESHVPPPESRTEFMSPEWRRLFKLAVAEASRLGLKMSVNLSSCAGALKGPWLVGDDAPKKLLWTLAAVDGPRSVQITGRRPDGPRLWDIAWLAARYDAPAAGAAKPSALPSAAVAWSAEWQGVAARPSAQPPLAEVVDLSGQIDAQGTLRWDAPPGRWVLLRFACAIVEGHEYDADILNAEAVAAHFQRMGRTLLDDAGPAAARTLTHFYSVSWEGAAPTWTLGFDKAFEKYRHYALRPYLPVLAGWTVKSRELSDRFLCDYYKSLADCFSENCYGRLSDLIHRAGLQWHSESGGPWDRKLPAFRYADQLAFLGRNDMPQGEFWHAERGLGRGFNRPSANAAHIYGRPRAATEAFTHMIGHWSAYPAVLKPDADAAFCDGINHFVWHTFSASPPAFGKPGIEYFAGTHINPNVTWFEQAGDFVKYLARCQFLLQQGGFVADVCCYTGDNPYLHWGRGERWSEKPTLAPVKGYDYDVLNTETLLERLSFADGALIMPDGLRYRVLVVDLAEETIPLAALRKLRELAAAGATLVLGQRRPTRTPGLTGYPAGDEEVRRLADELWGPAADPPARSTLGRGAVLRGTPLDRALLSLKVAPDFAGPWNYTHRRSTDCDIYFVAGSGSGTGTFRVRGREPEVWDPKTGRRQEAVCYQTSDDGRTIVPLDLPEHGSRFVVFRKPAQTRHLVAIDVPDGGGEIAGRSAQGAELRLWKNGTYRCESFDKKGTKVAVSDLPEPLTLTGPWDVRFAPGWGAPDQAVFGTLTAWDQHADSGIKHFSGTATYRQTFALNETQARRLVRLNLGTVRHIAQVRVNGRDLGVVWTAPWTVDLTGVVRTGQNELEVAVTNVWVNRLIGDAALPAEKRLTKTNIRLQAGPRERDFKLYQGYSAKDPLVTSGLLGPVRCEFGQAQEVRF